MEFAGESNSVNLAHRKHLLSQRLFSQTFQHTHILTDQLCHHNLQTTDTQGTSSNEVSFKSTYLTYIIRKLINY